MMSTVLWLTSCSSSLYTLFLTGNTLTLRVLHFNLISLPLPMKLIQGILDRLSKGRLTTSGLANLPPNNSFSLSRTSRRTHNPFSWSVISWFVSKLLFLTISIVRRRWHALGCAHRENITLLELRASCTARRCCPCNDAFPRLWCWSEYRGQPSSFQSQCIYRAHSI